MSDRHTRMPKDYLGSKILSPWVQWGRRITSDDRQSRWRADEQLEGEEEEQVRALSADYIGGRSK